MSTGIGNRIKNRRKKLGLSQEELANKMGLKSKSTICKIERGEDNLTTDTINKYADALNTTPFYLMGYEDEDGNVISETTTVPNNDLSFDEISKAYKLFKLYSDAPAEVQSAVEILLKSSQSDS